MKFNNLIYNVDHKLIVCMKHEYCIFNNSLKYYLRNIHAIKDDLLHATLAKIATLNIRDSRQIHLAFDNLIISHLILNTSYRCDLTTCKQITQFFNKNKRAIEKQLNKEHDIDHVKNKIKFIAINIEVVCVQSLLFHFYYHTFIIIKSMKTLIFNSSTNSSSHAKFSSRAKSSLREDFLILKNQY